MGENLCNFDPFEPFFCCAVPGWVDLTMPMGFKKKERTMSEGLLEKRRVMHVDTIEERKE